ncbi:Inh inhibitor of prohead protease [Aeromonas phage phiAS5]|uniref:Inh inhibitor of prohead protease n=1 Tax=Aeromonas phage phiAS5 TaxID=879630 RepID=E1A2C6_9CAUD|nr:minor head protein inhibitor of protease [Aeromonas phage phiAS5]ADM79872.1 Inh inhibitor of prohead protease [Aeromonas phage phiAS5]
MIDIEQIFKYRDELPAAEAKAAIQKYCKEHGVKVAKTGISLKDQIGLIMDKLDAMANGVTETTSFGPPDIADEPIVVEQECVGACPIDLSDAPVGEYKVDASEEGIHAMTVPEFISTQVIDVSTPRVNMGVLESMGILSQIGNGDVPSSGHHVVHIGNDYKPKTELIGYGKDAYMNLPYWILDWITEQPRDWKINVPKYDGNDKDFLMDMLYYIQTNGKVIVRESRNSQYHHFF